MIQINNLTKIINGRTILEIRDLRVNDGEINAIVGPADSGLDILLDLLIGKSAPSSGRISFDGLVPGCNQKVLDETIGILFHDDGLYPYMTVEKNLQFFTRLYGLPKDNTLEILTAIGLADQAKVKVRQLHTGFTRRLALGRALLHHPKILILCYPFARCDEGSLRLIKQIIRQRANQGNTILIMSEDTANLEDLCTQIFFLKGGRIDHIAEGKQPQVTNLPFKIPVRLQGKVALLNPGDILYAEASSGHTLLITKDAKLDSQYTLGELEERLKRSGFFRAHRSFLVNLQHVREVIPYSKNSFSLRLTDKEQTEIPLSKNSAAELRDMLDY